MSTKSKKSGKGSAKNSQQQYKANHIRERNKIRRILRSSGYDAALAYAGGFGMVGYLKTLVRE